MNTKERIQAYRNEMIETLRELVSYNSVYEESDASTPFGKTNADCLRAALSIASRHGLRPVNLDNYIGYGEIGTGNEVIGVVGHLDIVPSGEEWDSDPFTLMEKDGRLYGRGASDDKGPVVAALYALQVLQDEGYQFPKRVRLIMGCNEETGSLCLQHYVEKEGHFQYGFTPDAMFPGVYGEKGSIGATFFSSSTRILSMKGGVAANVVCNKCTTVLPKEFCDWELLRKYFEDNHLDYELSEEKDTVTLVLKGVAAHASTPELGVNAISHTFAGLSEAGSNDPFVKDYMISIGLATDGSKCGIRLSDDYGALTFNNGMIDTENGVITGTIDIRVPITLDSQSVADRMSASFAMNGMNLSIKRVGKSLFFPVDSPLVSALVGAYQSVTGDMDSKPMTMGGGTYAKGVNNCIGFGGEFGGEDTHIHDANEFIRIDRLLKQTEVYVEAIKRLCAL